MKKIKISTEHIEESRTKRKTREKILTTAYKMFSTEGLLSSTMVSLADRADVTRRTLYNYYETMDRVSQELHPLVLDYFESLLPEVQDQGDQVLLLKEYFLQLYAILESNRSLMEYLIRFDQFYNDTKVIPKEQSFSSFLKQKTPALTWINQIIPKQSSLASNVFIDCFIAYLFRVPFREESYKQEGSLQVYSFESYLDTLILGLVRLSVGKEQ